MVRTHRVDPAEEYVPYQRVGNGWGEVSENEFAYPRRVSDGRGFGWGGVLIVGVAE